MHIQLGEILDMYKLGVVEIYFDSIQEFINDRCTILMDKNFPECGGAKDQTTKVFDFKLYICSQWLLLKKGIVNFRFDDFKFRYIKLDNDYQFFHPEMIPLVTCGFYIPTTLIIQRINHISVISRRNLFQL